MYRKSGKSRPAGCLGPVVKATAWRGRALSSIPGRDLLHSPYFKADSVHAWREFADRLNRLRGKGWADRSSLNKEE
jgi:hypothetical protein